MFWNRAEAFRFRLPRQFQDALRTPKASSDQVELELLIAKQEADDIEELSAEGRFLRLQDSSSCTLLRWLQKNLENNGEY